MAANARKVDRGVPPGCPVQRNPDGTWQITGYAEGRTFLREHDTVQAGLGIETVENFPAKIRRPVLFRDGPEHREHRKQTAKFFTPRRVDEAYRSVMERAADRQIAVLRQGGPGHLSDLSFQLAVDVACAVIGLTNSKPGIKKRLDYFFPEKFGAPGFTSLNGLYWAYRQIRGWGHIYFADVRPAVKVRRDNRQDDLISHLIDEGCTAAEILGECLTFAAAGMITTREFIVMAAWHMFTDDELRTKYVAAAEPDRLLMLHELLRLEPIVAQLRRKTTNEINVGPEVVPSGAIVKIEVGHANLDTDEDEPLSICPGRSVGTGLSFGDGPHKCPGSHIAILESDIFLHKLFSLDGVRMAQAPKITFNNDIGGYELRGMQVTVG
ncbi:cytochrome P450 [Kibdelosporangium philippinense]|uniref:Cytochrome P450 n=1 Tax=Kibdelosporangium philippinense TaxID=211113 RepID=A0ABS8ZET1_9PSEU|nr:cytochrome P450 [Kibdelosporangium philippinense]MCE7006323.1 cytochrome P450 [Kibdelosporangium philippinense]